MPGCLEFFPQTQRFPLCTISCSLPHLPTTSPPDVTWQVPNSTEFLHQSFVYPLYGILKLFLLVWNKAVLRHVTCSMLIRVIVPQLSYRTQEEKKGHLFPIFHVNQNSTLYNPSIRAKPPLSNCLPIYHPVS